MRIGVDLGGSKTEVVCLDEGGAQKLRRRRPTPRGDYAATVATVAAMVREAERDCGAHCSVGVGIPGTISARTGLVKNANSTWLNARPLGRDLEAALGRPVRIANDANCFAISEAADGAGAGASTVFGVILGTGVGGALMVDGRVLAGANGIAGEWGHNPLPWPGAGELPGPACYCGRNGCIETWLCGSALVRDAHSDAHSDAHEAARRESSRDIGAADARPTADAPDARAVALAAAGGDARAMCAMDRYVDRLARGLASVINLFDPQVIVLGGGLSNIDCLYERVPLEWGRYVFSDTVLTGLRRNRHGDSSGVLGAARLWDDAAPVAVAGG
jgi:fructokinase